MRIAVADDEEILLEHLAQTVRSVLPRSEVIPFSDSFDLLKAAEKKVFDVVFLDIQMPGMTGIELAQKLNRLCERINMIFVTGFDGYQGEAMDLFASGYVKKPITREKLETQLAHLRYPVAEKKRLYAQTFGNFTLFLDGAPIKFSREKSQEILAYLIHRRGSLVSRKELSAVIFDDGVYDDNRRSYLSKLCSDISSRFEESGLPDFIVKTTTSMAINCDMLDCDLYDYLNGIPEARIKYRGEYMSQYAFGEEMIPYLEKSIDFGRKEKFFSLENCNNKLNTLC